MYFWAALSLTNEQGICLFVMPNLCPSYSTAHVWTCPALQAQPGPVEEGLQEPASVKHKWQSKYLESFFNTCKKPQSLCFSEEIHKKRKKKQVKIIYFAS